MTIKSQDHRQLVLTYSVYRFDLFSVLTFRKFLSDVTYVVLKGFLVYMDLFYHTFLCFFFS